MYVGGQLRDRDREHTEGEAETENTMMRQRTCMGGESRGKKSEVEGYVRPQTNCELSNVSTLMEGN